jgi:hypothetical protein
MDESRSTEGPEETASPPPVYESPLEDWVLITLPPSFALTSKAEPSAVVLNYTGNRISENRRIKLLRETCNHLFNRQALGP